MDPLEKSFLAAETLLVVDRVVAGSGFMALRLLVLKMASRISILNKWGYSQDFIVGGIAEVLSALERIEQDEELTYEQLLVLDTNLFLNGVNFYGQHREMRLDIDNMHMRNCWL